MQFLQNIWYVAAHGSELKEEQLTRRILDNPVLLYRKQDGTIAAISNICPHRFAPLDRGLRFGDTIECPYHGLQFGPDGTCVLNPHTDHLDRKMDVPAYTAIERHGLVWIWMGKAEPDPALIPDMSGFEDADGVSVCRSYLNANYRYDILIDNLLDLSHADYLHRGSFSSGVAEETDLHISEEAHNNVVINRLQKRCDPPPFMPHIDFKIDMLTHIRWSPSQAILFHSGFGPAGQPIQSLDGPRFYHVATPESAGKTHYFMGVVREGASDEEADRALAKMQREVIATEDGPMLEFLSEYMDGQELMDMQPLILPTDAGGLRARRTMNRLMQQELAAV